MIRFIYDNKTESVKVLAPGSQDDDIHIDYDEDNSELLIKINPTEFMDAFNERIPYTLHKTKLLNGVLEDGILTIYQTDVIISEDD